MEENTFYRQLVQRYMENKATDEELEIFFHLLEEGKLDEYVAEYMDAPPAESGKNIRRIRYNRWVAALVLGIILLAGAALYLVRHHRIPAAQQLAESTATAPSQDIKPGGNKAVLTLADGSTITLDSAATGRLPVQGSTVIMKQAGGKLTYQANGVPQTLSYNTLATPRGGKYQLVLPDGTTVLLNAASSLRYPTAFPGNERVVELNGEAYFEVTQKASQPFRVKILPQSGHTQEKTVEVLGTSFNIMAYNDEPFTRTTLVKGAVRVAGNGATAMLAPGQDALMNNTSAGGIKVGKANMEAATAWKNGEFYFSNTDIYDIMRQLSRWYNVEVSYEDSLHVFLNGNIRKNVNVSQVLKMLELTGEVQFKTSGNKVTVSSSHRH